MDDRADYTIAPWDRADNASRALVRLITQSTNDGIWDWNLETDEVYYSPRWLELIGYLPGEFPGNMDAFLQRIHPDDHDNALRIAADYLSSTLTEYRNEFRLRHKDGPWRWILSRGIALRDASNRAIRFAGTHTDITDRVHAAERLESMVAERTIDLQAARDSALLLAAARTKFLAAVSHDIRQPLQAMVLQLARLKNDVTTLEGKQRLFSIERSLGSAMELLDQLLEYIKLDAGALKPRLTTVNVGNLFELLSDTFGLVAAQKGLRLTILPTKLAAESDPKLLGRILRNLVSNAIKYTERGRVVVGCRWRDNRVRIEVWDTGCGIPTEQLRQIFWEFVQFGEGGRQHAGLGLGLAIVDRLAKSLGHRIEVRSWPGRGSVFAVDMPRVSRSSIASSKDLSAQPSDEPFASKLIAVIDDDLAVSEAIADLLQAWGATAVCAIDDDELLRALAGRRPDAVITDGNLGGAVDGFTALNQLEKHFRGVLPALIITGDYDVINQERSNNAGRHVLHKPVWPDALLAALRFELGRATQM